MKKPRTVALALGSGGARGYAHVGALQVLAEAGIEVVGVAGSSMGALVGGLHAAGRLDDYMEWALGLSQFDVLRLLDPSLSAPGMIRAEKVFARVRDYLGGRMIEDLPIPYTAVATDLLARKEVWFQEGPLDTAIRASIAIPSVVTPVVINGRLLVDGGLLDPVPIAPISAVRADATLAVTLNGEARGHEAPPPPTSESAAPRPVEEWGERFRRAASKLLDNDAVRALTARFAGAHDEREDERDDERDDERSEDEREDERSGYERGEVGGGGDGMATGSPATDADAAAAVAAAVDDDAATPDQPAAVPELSRFDVMNLSIEAMQNVLTRYRFAGNAPDVLVSVPKDACRSLEFHRAAELVELGRTLTTEALERAGWLDPLPAD